jgi:hypothetical protein
VVTPGWTAVRPPRQDSAGRPALDSTHRPDPRRTRTIDLSAATSDPLAPVVAALAIGLLVLLAISLVLARQVAAVRRRLAGLTRGEDGRSLEAILGAHLEKVHAATRELERLDQRRLVIESDLRLALGRVGLVRFNPFEDTGGNQSFALAVVDGEGSGFVVSSLHARSSTRLYAKAVVRGAAEGALSAEEAEALRIALARPVGIGPG